MARELYVIQFHGILTRSFVRTLLRQELTATTRIIQALKTFCIQLAKIYFNFNNDPCLCAYAHIDLACDDKRVIIKVDERISNYSYHSRHSRRGNIFAKISKRASFLFISLYFVPFYFFFIFALAGRRRPGTLIRGTPNTG